MPQRNASVRPAVIDRAVRLTLALLAAVFGYYGVTSSLAKVLAKSNPALAHTLSPYDGRTTARLASSLAGAKATASDRLRADDLARRALRQDPTAVAAASTLGINAQIRSDTATARRLFAYGQTISRRDLQTQLWAIEDAVGRDDIPETLRQYDIALRTNPRMSDTLFAVLASAVSDQAIRAALLRTLATRPPWSERFIDRIAASGPHPSATAALFFSLRRSGVAISESADADIINALLAAGHFDRAWAYYVSVRGVADRSMSRDPRFVGFEKPSQLDWMAINDGGVSTSVRDGAVDFSAPASVGGPLLRQTQLLAVGGYRLTGHSEGIDQADGARPYWLLTCQGSRELGRIVIPNSNQSDGNFSGRFSVPSECPLQVLLLVARPSDAVSGVSGRIDRAQLAPIR